MLRNSIVTSFMLLYSYAVHANTPEVNLIYSMGITSGGDMLAERTDGVKLKAGGMFYFSMGAVFILSEDFQLQAGFGYHYDDLEASDTSVSFDRTFAEIVTYYLVTTRTRLGLGVVNAFSAEYSGTSDTYGFDNALGLVTEINWQNSRNSWWGLRYVEMEYIANSINGISISNEFAELNGLVVDGSYLGLMFHGQF